MRFSAEPVLYKSSFLPAHDPATGIGPNPGDLWVDMTVPVLKRMVSRNPDVWVSVEGGGSGGAVTAVFTRTGNVLAARGDYTTLQLSDFSATPPASDGKVPIWNQSTSQYVPGDPIVSGPAAEGATPINNPVWVAGKGADGFIHSVRTANDGTVRMDPSGTTPQPVTGTFWQATQPVSGPLTDTQLRASAVSVISSVTAIPQPPVTLNKTATAEADLIAAPGPGVSLYICKGSAHNRGSATNIVTLRDGAAGTVRWKAELAPDGGGSLFDFGSRGWKLTANTSLSVALGSVGDVDFNVSEYYIAA